MTTTKPIFPENNKLTFDNLIDHFDETTIINNHLNMQTYRIYNLGGPEEEKDAVPKDYVDNVNTQPTNYVNNKTYSLTSANITGNLDYSRIDNKPTAFPTTWASISDKRAHFRVIGPQ